METVDMHPSYGKITYTESFWTGKKSLFIADKEALKLSRKSFRTEDGAYMEVKGNFMTGAVLHAGGEAIRLTPAVKWYEIVLSVLPFLLVMVWGNTPALFAIVPIVGGAIGGAIGGIFFVVNLYSLRAVHKVWLKVVISVGMLALCFVICFLVAVLILQISA